MSEWEERWPQRLCTEDERQRMGARAFSDDGGPFGSALAAHPARLHWQFLVSNFVRNRTWPRGRSVLMDDMRLQWLRIGGGWSFKVASARGRYTAEELAESGARGEWTRGPLIFMKVRHPARLHRQTMLSNVVNYGWLPVWPSRRDGAYREQWMLNRRYLVRWPLYRVRRWQRQHRYPRIVTGRLDDPRMAGIHQRGRLALDRMEGSWHGTLCLITGYRSYRRGRWDEARAWILVW